MILRRLSLIRPGVLRLVLPAIFAAALLVALPALGDAHDIPSSVMVLAFVRPQGRTLRLVMRVPLEAMRDVNFPFTGPGYLDLTAAAPLMSGAAKVWLADEVTMYEDGRQLPSPSIIATHVSLPSDRSFSDYASAVSHTTGAPLPASTQIVWNQAMLDVVLEYPIQSDSSRFSIDPEFARLGVHTTTVLRFLPARGAERVFEYLGDPGLIHLQPHWYQSALRFVHLGFDHILSGIDHLLFIFCLVIPFRKIRPLVAIISSFTVAHSITLIASALGFAPNALWFPPLIEALIALSIVYMALENIVGAKLERRWIIAFGFGLVHGFGFSFALRESMQFAGAHLATSLVSFNVGVELGQLLLIAIAVPVLNWAFTHVVEERMGTIILSAIVAHTAWHWMIDRGTVLMQYRFQMPVFDAAFAASAMHALMLALIVGAAAWGLFELYGRLGRRSATSSSATP
ncbi:MAG TPA: HupE/UreJ family protein [Gemmatimonadaceae bacterium]